MNATDIDRLLDVLYDMGIEYDRDDNVVTVVNDEGSNGLTFVFNSSGSLETVE